MKTDHERIFEWLADGEYHCSTEMDFMRDARKRISEINKKKIIIEGIPCDGRCGTQHRSKSLKMRRWIQDANHEKIVKIPLRALHEATGQSDRVLIPIKGIIENETIKFFQMSLL